VTEQTLVPVAQRSELPQGATRVVTLAGVEVLLCHTAEGIFAVQNLCSHAAERLCNGKLKGHRLICPLHGAAFDVRDGAALSRPARLPLATYDVVLEGDRILLRGIG
jgi:3-phenylpropionate/trans-cinnamate dioxygenase ferredoxin subunit